MTRADAVQRKPAARVKGGVAVQVKGHSSSWLMITIIVIIVIIMIATSGSPRSLGLAGVLRKLVRGRGGLAPRRVACLTGQQKGNAQKVTFQSLKSNLKVT